MWLDDIPPDISFSPIERTLQSQELAYQLKKESLGPHVSAKWSWDDELQRSLHGEQIAKRDILKISLRDEIIGTVAVGLKNECLQLDDFYITPALQGQGHGARVLEHIQTVALNIGVPLALQVLKWNPAVGFYRRCGLYETGETETHFLMCWQAEQK